MRLYVTRQSFFNVTPEPNGDGRTERPAASLPLSVLTAPGAASLAGGKWPPTISIFNKLKLRNNSDAMFFRVGAGGDKMVSHKKGSKKKTNSNLGNQ